MTEFQVHSDPVSKPKAENDIKNNLMLNPVSTHAGKEKNIENKEGRKNGRNTNTVPLVL